MQFLIVRCVAWFVAQQPLANVDRAPQRRGGLGWSYANWGTALVAAGRLAEAETVFEKALHVRAKLLQDNMTNAEHQQEIAISCRDLGNVRLAAGRPAEAAILLRAAADIRQQICDEHPGDVAARLSLANDLMAYGDALAQAAQWSEGAAAFARAVQVGALANRAKWSHALLTSAAGDQPAYQAAREQLVAQLGPIATSEPAVPIILSLILGEKPLKDVTPLEMLAAQVAQGHAISAPVWAVMAKLLASPSAENRQALGDSLASSMNTAGEKPLERDFIAWLGVCWPRADLRALSGRQMFAQQGAQRQPPHYGRIIGRQNKVDFYEIITSRKGAVDI